LLEKVGGLVVEVQLLLAQFKNYWDFVPKHIYSEVKGVVVWIEVLVFRSSSSTIAIAKHKWVGILKLKKACPAASGLTDFLA